MTFLTGTGRDRVQIAHFFRGQIGSGIASGLGLVVGICLYRIRHRRGSLVPSESPGSKIGLNIAKAAWAAERNRPRMLAAAAYAV